MPVRTPLSRKLSVERQRRTPNEHPEFRHFRGVGSLGEGGTSCVFIAVLQVRRIGVEVTEKAREDALSPGTRGGPTVGHIAARRAAWRR